MNSICLKRPILHTILSIGIGLFSLSCGGPPNENDVSPVISERAALLSPLEGSSLNFTETDLGLTASLVVTIENSSPDVSATQISFQSAQAPFGLLNDQYPGSGGDCEDQLQAASRCTIVLKFTPLLVGPSQGVLSLSYFDGIQEQTLSLNLNGQGVQPTIPTVLGVSDDSTIRQNQSWNWTCNLVCNFRFHINQNSDFSFSSQVFSSVTSAVQNSGNGVYYLHVQAQDKISLQLSDIKTVQVTLDNTEPSTPSSLSLSGTASDTKSKTLSWLPSSDENGISHYEMAIGTTAGAFDVSAGWINIGLSLSAELTGLSLTSLTNYYTSIRAVDVAGNRSSVTTSIPWTIPVEPEAVTNLSIISASYSQIELGWSKPSENGYSITDYFIDYKESSQSQWLTFNDGVSTDTIAMVTGLNENTSYDFRVTAYSGSSSQYSPVATGRTTISDPFFNPTEFKAMNLGGATESSVVAYEDGTEIKINELNLATLNTGQTYIFSSTQNDILSSSRPFFVAGRRGSGSAGQKGNIVWNTPDWAGRSFMFTGTRSAPHIVTVYSFEDSNITIEQNGALIDSQFVPAKSNYTFSISVNGGFKMQSDGMILAYEFSSGNGSEVADPKPLIPANPDLIGFPSSTLQLTTSQNNNPFNLYHSNGSVGSGALILGEALSISPQGNSSLYQSEALRVIADQPLVGNSNADSNGLCSAPFLPVSMMRKNYAINVEAAWVAFASVEPGVIEIVSPDGSISTLDFQQSGSQESAPYRARLNITAAGTLFRSTSRFAAWYEPRTDIGGSSEDETLLYGF